MSSSEVLVQKKKLPLVKLAVLAVALTLGAVVLLRGAHPKELLDQGMALVRSAGPVIFFAAEAVMPALGAPLLAFNLAAGEAFSAQLTMPGVIAAAGAAILVNLALTYWLARYALRPLLTRLIARYGYNVPRVTAENALSVALLVRLTPGPPFFLQGYLLGLAEVPFRLYMVVSFLCVLPWSIGAIVLGEGLMKGNFKAAGLGMGVLVAAVVVVQIVRRKYAKPAAGV